MNGRKRLLSVPLDTEHDGEIRFLMMRLKSRIEQVYGIDVDSWIEETRQRGREMREAWRRE